MLWPTLPAPHRMLKTWARRISCPNLNVASGLRILGEKVWGWSKQSVVYCLRVQVKGYVYNVVLLERDSHIFLQSTSLLHHWHCCWTHYVLVIVINICGGTESLNVFGLPASRSHAVQLILTKNQRRPRLLTNYNSVIEDVHVVNAPMP